MKEIQSLPEYEQEVIYAMESQKSRSKQENDFEYVPYVQGESLSDVSRRTRHFAKKLDCPMAIIDKRRDKHNEAIATHIIGDVEGKICLMFDDMIDTAGTICEASKLLKSKGAKAVYVGATHAVLSGPARDRIKEAPIEQVFVTNTIPWKPEELPSNVKQLSIAPLLGQAISRIHDDESVSSLFGFEKEMKV